MTWTDWYVVPCASQTISVMGTLLAPCVSFLVALSWKHKELIIHRKWACESCHVQEECEPIICANVVSISAIVSEIIPNKD